MIIQSLPNNKASGPNGITYELIKHLNSENKDFIKWFFEIIRKTGTHPYSWQYNRIFPILKSKSWNCSLTNTRPILMIDVIRKTLMKLVNQRLATILKYHKVLLDSNYTGLPGESVYELILILQSLVEHANQKKQELWILFQDTAKVFDTVNINILNRAMTRIKIPGNIKALITFLFKGRNLRVITPFGLSDPIIAGDGIDQGEAISPLLW